MAKYVLTRKAVADLENIWNYTVEVWSASQAEEYYLLLIDGFEELAANAEKGRNYDEIEPGLRGFRIGKHIVFYLVFKSRIEVVRVLHEQMDLKWHLTG